MAHHIITITTDPSARLDQRYVVALSGVTGAHLCGVQTQAAAEHFADGLAYGLRLAGHTVRIDIDIPDDVVAAGDIDFAMLDTPDTARPAKAASAPERDPVEARLEQERMSEFFRAAHHGWGSGF